MLSLKSNCVAIQDIEQFDNERAAPQLSQRGCVDEWNEARESMNLPMYLYLPTGLSEQDKELILLRIDKKLSFDKIAEYYGITNDACRQRLSRAIRKCRSLLDCEK